VPGVCYSAYFPTSGDYGSFHGVCAKYLIYSWISRRDNPLPGHGRFYAALDLLFSTEPDVSEMLTYALGLDLSFEGGAKRRFLIPYYGLEMGGMYQKSIRSLFQFTPVLGIHIFADDGVFVSLGAGYLLPTYKLEELHGPRVNLGANLVLW
jgi:hypothetical protein